MKKICKVLVSIMIFISAALMLFACGKKDNVLSTPQSVGIVHNDVYNGEIYSHTQTLIVTDSNKYATSYKFFITDNENYEDKSNYISFISNTNHFDITNYFNSKKEYHYFVQYIGTKKYKNSQYSEIKSYTPTPEKIDAPYIQLNGKVLSWFRIMNATGYEVYEKVIDKRVVSDNDEINVQSTKIETLGAETFSLNLSNRFNEFDAPYKKYVYTVKALSSGYYTNSDISLETTYIKEIELEKPSNLSVIVEDSKYYLTWDNVPYATKYSVVVGGNYGSPVETNENKLEITNYLTNYSTFSFTVRAMESDVIIAPNPSEYSATLEYDYTTTLSAPQNLTATRDGEYVEIGFDKVTLTTLTEEENSAITYTLIILYNGNEVCKDESLEEPLFKEKIEKLVGNVSSNKNITIKVKANNFGNYVFESEFVEINYTIETGE